MWYMPYARVRRAVLIYAFLTIGISLIAVAFWWWPGAVHLTAANAKQLGGLRFDGSALLAGSAAVVGGFATVLGLNLAAENDGHLELAWTKPVSREAYALGLFGVDVLAIAVCIALTAGCGAFVADVCLGHQAFDFPDGAGAISALAFCGFPLCIYAWITALSASLKRNRGTVAGLFWPLMIAIAALGVVRIPAVHAVAVTLNALNPLAIFISGSGNPPPSLTTYLSGWAVAALLLVAAIVQWRRLEI